MTGVAAQLRALTDGAVDVIREEELATRVRAVAAGDRPPLRVKFGMDPTSPDVHVGHTVVLRKLRAFQEHGHTAVLIVGGFTAQVGDPSGRSTTRPALTAEEVAANGATYLEQVRHILLPERLELVDNAGWLAPLEMADVLRLTAGSTVAQMLERADFAERYAAGRPIAVSELLYPLLQGYDSVVVRADVELGGTDQTFNLLLGRDLQQAAGQPPQVVMTMPLLEGLDGSAKMSKTAGNTIGVREPPAEMFGKAMSIRDDLMEKYLRFTTVLRPDEVDGLVGSWRDGSLHPAALKRRLARELVTLHHSADAAAAAEERFDVAFRRRGIPDDVPEVPLGDASTWFLPDLLQHAALAGSGSEARRLVRQGAVRLDGDVLEDPTAVVDVRALSGRVLQVGRRRFARLTAG